MCLSSVILVRQPPDVYPRPSPDPMSLTLSLLVRHATSVLIQHPMTFLIRAVHAEVHARHVECATTCAITWVLFACCLCRRPPRTRTRRRRVYSDIILLLYRRVYSDISYYSYIRYF